MVFIIILALMSVGCAAGRSDWKMSQELNTLCAYEAFVKKHPNSTVTKEAESRIEKLLWQKALNENEEQEYREFLAKYPNSKFAPQIRRRLELIVWQKTREENSHEAYKKFISQYPQGKFTDMARERVAWETAYSKDTIQAYKEFLSVYPEGVNTNHAKNNIEKQAWKEVEKTKSIEDYESYLKRYPSGRFAGAAEKAIQLREYTKNCKPVSRRMAMQMKRELSEYIGAGQGESLIADVKDFSMNVVGLSDKGKEVDLTHYMSTEKKGEIRTQYFISKDHLQQEESKQIYKDISWHPAEKVVRHKTEITTGSTVVLKDGRSFTYLDGTWYLCTG